MIRSIIIYLSFLLFSFLENSNLKAFLNNRDTEGTDLTIEQDEAAGTISIKRKGSQNIILVQNAKANFRPYMHPITAPDGKGILTEYSPAHHKHQTGLYWGFTRVNGRDFFHHPEGEYWQRVAATVLQAEGLEVKWQTIYNLLDEAGNPMLQETQNWIMSESNGKFFLNVEWRGKALVDITIGKYNYGGLFLRMPWHEGIKGEVINAARQKNEKAEGQRAMWVDVGMRVEGREDFAHVAIFDHIKNTGYPQYWRVDNQLGIGPARAREGDWVIKKGETEIIKHQLVVYSGDLDDLELTNLWVKYTGNSGRATAALWELAKKEGRHAKLLSPQEAADTMTLKEGYKVNTWASEPMMTQPMAFCWDDRGRMWVAENRDYESRGRGFSSSGKSRILILEDTNGDGIADKQKVFMEGIAFPAALAVGFDGVFIGAPPNLLFVPDANHDDVADIENIQVRLTGWGIRDRHETLNSLHWGPDGWLYGCQGFATTSKVRKPKDKGKLYQHNDPFPENLLEEDGIDINGGVWRYHPTKDRFEVVAHGFSNPWGIDYNAKGELFISACVIPHMWHVIPGGIYHRQGGQHFNPYIYNDIKTITNHSHRSAHGGARIYQSDAFPSDQQGRIFMANIHEHAVLSDVLTPKGSGYIASHGDDFMLANNAQWVGFSMEIGPDGGVYALDWHDADICGQEVLNSETGRIFRIMPIKSFSENWKGRYSDLSKFTDAELVALQLSKSDWHSRRARIILQNRASKNQLNQDTHSQLLKIFESNPNNDFRLRAMWGLHITNGLSSKVLQKALDDKDEHIRSWAIQLFCEDRNAPIEALTKFIEMAKSDKSPVVRLHLASALQRLNAESIWNISAALMMHAEDEMDHNMPKMIWFGLEPLVAKNPSRAIGLGLQGKIPLLTNYIAHRMVDASAMEILVKSLETLPNNKTDILQGMIDGMEARTDLKPPLSWKSVYTKLKKSDEKTAKLSSDVADLFGDLEATQRSLNTLKNKKAPLDQRKNALKMLASQQRKEVIKEIPSLLEESPLRTESIRAIAAFDSKELGQLLLKKYKIFSSSEKAEVIQTMSSRPAYGWLLTEAIKDSSISRRDISANAARQLRRVAGSGVVEILGAIDDTPHDDKVYKKYKDLLTEEAVRSANHKNGQILFQQTCGGCHKMYGQGGIIGPELTGSNRSEVDYLLLNILNPSDEIQDNYRMVVVTTRDGRTYSGNIVSENERQITMRIVGQDAVVINKSSIQSRETTPVSMMPQGLLNRLTDKEVLDLIGFLNSPKQVK